MYIREDVYNYYRNLDLSLVSPLAIMICPLAILRTNCNFATAPSWTVHAVDPRAEQAPLPVICPESNSYSFFVFIYNNSILYACSPRVVCARVVCLVTSLECQAGSKAPDW